jgi:Anthrone oxygenase
VFAAPLALTVAALFTGAALYVNLVEQPARLALDDGPLLTEWKLSYARATIMQAGLAVIGFILGVIAWWQGAGWLWVLGGLVLLANWPYTFYWVMPLNRRLAAFEAGTTEVQLHALVAEWGRLHAVRSALGVLACLLFILASA